METIGRYNVVSLPIGILQQGDACRTIGIILDCSHPGIHARLVSLEIDDAVKLLVPSSSVS
jgi:hypothetical protein